jgi:ABC-type sugar transport system substrate-binding protein
MERHQGFMAAISNFPDIKLIDKADAAWERERRGSGNG